MNNDGTNTFQKENNFSKGKPQGCRNKQQMALQEIGLERALGLVDLQTKAAENGSEDAQRFLISMFVARPKPGRFINIPLPKIKTIDDVLPAQEAVMDHVTNGNLTVDEADNFFKFIEQYRKTIEVTDLVAMIQGIDNRMKDAGI